MLVTILTNAKDCSDGFSGNGKNTNTDILDGNDLRANIVCADTQIITIAATVNQIVSESSKHCDLQDVYNTDRPLTGA